MKKNYFLLAGAAFFLSTACVSSPESTNVAEQRPVVAGYESYDCENGLAVGIKQLNDEQISLMLNEDATQLTIAPAASGELYLNEQGLFGKRTEWHTKNKEAAFSFYDQYGNLVETTCRAK